MATTLRGWMLPTAPEPSPSGRRKSWLFAVYTVRKFTFDRCGSMAAVLTLDTLLSVVPLFGIAMLLVGLLSDDQGERWLGGVLRGLFPQSGNARELARDLVELGRNVSLSNLGAWGFLAAIGIAFFVFLSLESSYNRIWSVSRSRSLLSKFTTFYALATLGPLLVLYSLAAPFFSGVSDLLTSPIITTSIGLVLVNRLMPNTPVSWIAALVGGLFSALSFELGKALFGIYLQRVAQSTYEGLYGPLATVPIFVVWSFLSWIMVLLGAEVTFVVQNRKAVANSGYLNPHLGSERNLRLASGRTAARLLLAICDNWARRAEPLSSDALSVRFHLGFERVTELMTRLSDGGFVLEIERPARGFVPACPLESIRLAEVLLAFEIDETGSPRAGELDAMFANLDASRHEQLEGITYAQLVTRDDRNAPVPTDATAPGE